MYGHMRWTRRAVVWPAALLGGSVVGLALRLVLFALGDWLHGMLPGLFADSARVSLGPSSRRGRARRSRAGAPAALWVSEFAPGGMAIPDRPDGFQTMWGDVRRHPERVLGGAVYAWTRNGPEGVDRNFGLTDDGVAVDGRSLAMLDNLFHLP